ncbi:MAG: hypothetical protein IIU14_01620 [Ruminococcus sp.]|nr:hypothetical protein [Ruminococcus sp.]
MEEYNVKCTKCGYIFFDNGEEEKCVCPLCSEECDREEAEKGFREVENGFIQKQKRTTKRMILDMLVLGLSFSAFVIIMYFLVTVIVTAGK